MANIFTLQSPFSGEEFEKKHVKVVNPQDPEGNKISIFKKINVPNLEKIITSSQSIFSDFINFAGELWHKDPENPEEEPLEPKNSESSSVIYEEPSSEVIILHRVSLHNNSQNFEIKPKKLKNSKSFATPAFRPSQLQIDDDVMPIVENIKNQSLIDESHIHRNISEYGEFLGLNSNTKSILKQNVSLLQNSTSHLDSNLEASDLQDSYRIKPKVKSVRIDDQVKEKPESEESEKIEEEKHEKRSKKHHRKVRKGKKDKNKKKDKIDKIDINDKKDKKDKKDKRHRNHKNHKKGKKNEKIEKSEQSKQAEKFEKSKNSIHFKSNSTINLLNFPKVIKIRHKSATIRPNILAEYEDPKSILETSPDFPESIKLCSKDAIQDLKPPSQQLPRSISQSSLGPFLSQIPKSVLYQIPILTFEEFISSLMNQKILNPSSSLWTQSFLNRICSCCTLKLNIEDTHICEQLIEFSMNKFNFQNSLHLILLLSCFNCVTKADRWPVNMDDWFEMGFETNNVESQLENFGSLSLLHIFFLSSYFSEFYEELIRVRRLYGFDLYSVISAVSQVILQQLRAKKLNKLIKNFGSGLEVVFFYFAGIMLFWFKQILRNKDQVAIWEITKQKASSASNDLLQEAWNIFQNKNNNN